MRYADPSANRDLLGNRTLLFIFICAFALVTLLQQILYSRSYIKSDTDGSVQEFCLVRPNFGRDCYVLHPRRKPRKGCCEEGNGVVQVCSEVKVYLGKRMAEESIWWPGKAPWGGGAPLGRESRGFQFAWQREDQQANWTGLFNDSDSLSEQSISDFRSRYFEFYKGPLEFNSTRCLELRQEILDVKVLSMVKQSDLFDRWKSLQICKWAMDSSEASLFKSTLSRCCNAPGFLFTTQKNTPVETNLRYEVDSSGFYHINKEIFQMFPKEMPYYRSQFKKCAVVGNGGILKDSGCGKEINSADFVFRCNLPPISGEYATDVGEKTDVVTVNPSIIIDRFHKLEKWRRPFFRVLQLYKNASVLLPAFYTVRNTLVSFRVKYLLDDFGSQQQVYFFHPLYLSSVTRYWLSLGVRAKRISTGLILVTAALELCEEVHLFGFWAFPMNPSGFHITHHYYDNVKPKPGFHAMPSEIFAFLHLHSRGILQVHTGTCNYG